MKLFKKGFTLSELLIALAVVGVLLAILIPIIMNIMPDQNGLMAKRAYYTVQTVVSDLLNDDSCYPDKSKSTDRRIGFDDGYGYIDCEKWGGSSDTSSFITNENAAQKFRVLFANKLDLKNKDNYNYSYLKNNTNLETKDGMLWYIPDCNFSSSCTITVDVNGNEGENNYASDKFTVSISREGNLEIGNGWARKAIDINKDVTEEEESS